MPNHVRDWMSSPVVVVDPDSSVSYAMTLMRRRAIHSVVVDTSEKNPAYGIITTTDIRDHHLPVADASGALIGLISATDIFMAVEETGWEENGEE